MKISETDEAVTLEPAGPATACVLWLHGLGADGHDFVPVVDELDLPADAGVRFVFPHAPVRPITINNGMAMRAWYDIPSLQDLRRQDEAGIRESERLVRAWLQREVDGGIPLSRIVLAGFSQGGAIALHAGLRLDAPLAGILALSTYLPLHDRLAAEGSAAAKAVRILMCHGRLDPMLPYAMGQGSCEELRRLGYSVEWREYLMQHQVCMEEIVDIAGWLKRRLLDAA